MKKLKRRIIKVGKGWQKAVKKLRKRLPKYWAVMVLVAIMFLAGVIRFQGISETPSYLFDECYHVPPARLIARGDKAAFEWWHGDLSSEAEGEIDLSGAYIDWLHPPLHKYWRALNINWLGNNELAWRLGAASSGVMCVGLIGWLGWLCWCDKKSIGLLAALLVAADPLMITQSRVGMNDMMVIALSLGAVVLWKKWQQNGQRQRKGEWRGRKYQRDQWWWLGMSFVMGLAVATKWSAVLIMPAIAGLTYFDGMANEKLKSPAEKIQAIVVFGLVAFLVYVMTYVPALVMGKNWSDLIELHRQIFLYQKRTDLVHYRSSTPWEWIMGEKSIIYTTRPEQTRVVEFKANKILLSMGLVGVMWTGISLSWRKIGEAQRAGRAGLALGLVMYLMAFLPWVLSPRIMFMYHYLPALPYLYLLLSFWLVKMLGLIFRSSENEPSEQPEQ